MRYTKTLIPALYGIAALLFPGTMCLAADPPEKSTAPAANVGAAVAVDMEDTFFSRFEFHVSLSQGYLLSNTNDWIGETNGGTFDFNEFAANVNYNFTDSLRVGFQLMSRDFGPLMDNMV